MRKGELAGSFGVAQGCTHERCLGRRADALRVMRGERLSHG